MRTVILESLESRTLYSVVTDSDQAAVDAASKKLSSDQSAQATILDSDKSKLAGDKQSLLNLLTPLLNKLKDDEVSRLKAIQDDKAQGLAARLLLQTAIKADANQIAIDKADAAALIKDKAKLLTDKTALKNAVFNKAKAIADDNLKYVDILKADRDLLTSTKQNDKQFNTDRTKLFNDTATAAKLLAGDAKVLAKAKFQLYKDQLLGN